MKFRIVKILLKRKFNETFASENFLKQGNILLSFSPSDIITVALSLPDMIKTLKKSSGVGSSATSNVS